MQPLKTIPARLAFQVDRKILSLPEADFFRVDFPAHEHLSLSGVLTLKKPFFLALPSRFLLTALVIFAILFGITNAPAFAKILMANVSEAIIAKEATLEPISPVIFEIDPWTGKQNVVHVAEENPLESREEAALTPEDGLPLLSIVPTAYDNRVSIPSLKVNAPIVEPTLGVEALVANDWNVLEDQIRSSLLQGVVHYPGSAEPGQKGNVFLTGHSSNVFWEVSPYNTVFALLPKIELGADILITYEQTEYRYKVLSKREARRKHAHLGHLHARRHNPKSPGGLSRASRKLRFPKIIPPISLKLPPPPLFLEPPPPFLPPFLRHVPAFSQTHSTPRGAFD